MQRIIKDGKVIDETWRLLPQDATLDGISNCDDLIVPLALGVEHSHALKARDGGLGVWLEAGEEIEEIADQLDISVKTVEAPMRIAFTKIREDFKDGLILWQLMNRHL